jgi:hypothetical protein
MDFRSYGSRFGKFSARRLSDMIYLAHTYGHGMTDHH